MKVQLKVLRGSHAGKCVPLSGPHFLIGRGEDCQLRPNSDSVSRRHCQFTIGPSQVSVADLGSRNGTFVNDAMVSGDCVLKSGDRVRVGPLEFEVLFTDSHVKVEPQKEKVPAEQAAGSPDEQDIIGQWLDEADEAVRTKRLSDPDTRQFKLDETDRLVVGNGTGQPVAGGASAKRKSKQRPPEKREPGKLPAKARQSTAKDTHEAAAQMLRKLFNRG